MEGDKHRDVKKYADWVLNKNSSRQSFFNRSYENKK
jgi:hypothetical protein